MALYQFDLLLNEWLYFKRLLIPFCHFVFYFWFYENFNIFTVIFCFLIKLCPDWKQNYSSIALILYINEINRDQDWCCHQFDGLFSLVFLQCLNWMISFKLLKIFWSREIIMEHPLCESHFGGVLFFPVILLSNLYSNNEIELLKEEVEAGGAWGVRGWPDPRADRVGQSPKGHVPWPLHGGDTTDPGVQGVESGLCHKLHDGQL